MPFFGSTAVQLVQILAPVVQSLGNAYLSNRVSSKVNSNNSIDDGKMEETPNDDDEKEAAKFDKKISNNDEKIVNPPVVVNNYYILPHSSSGKDCHNINVNFVQGGHPCKGSHFESKNALIENNDSSLCNFEEQFFHKNLSRVCKIPQNSEESFSNDENSNSEYESDTSIINSKEKRQTSGYNRMSNEKPNNKNFQSKKKNYSSNNKCYLNAVGHCDFDQSTRSLYCKGEKNTNHNRRNKTCTNECSSNYQNNGKNVFHKLHQDSLKTAPKNTSTYKKCYPKPKIKSRFYNGAHVNKHEKKQNRNYSTKSVPENPHEEEQESSKNFTKGNYLKARRQENEKSKQNKETLDFACTVGSRSYSRENYSFSNNNKFKHTKIPFHDKIQFKAESKNYYHKGKGNSGTSCSSQSLELLEDDLTKMHMHEENSERQIYYFNSKIK